SKDYGKYAINDGFFKSPGLMDRYAGKHVTPAQVIANPALQDTIFNNFAHYWLSKGKSPDDVASMWHHGESSTTQQNDSYVKKFDSFLSGQQ
ncbi:MAG TPA: hypothetical protein VIJ14_01565, partial [Rhabdochlamydiaceae bacterium]